MKELLFSTCSIIGENLYCVTLFENILAKINIKTYDVECIDDIKGYTRAVRKTVSLIKENQGYLYIFEHDGKRAIRINVKTKDAEIIELCKKNNNGYSSVEFYKDKMYLFPKYDNKILIVDLKTKRCEDSIPIFGCVQSATWEYKDIKIPKKNCLCTYRDNEKIYVFSGITKDIIYFDIFSKKIEKVNSNFEMGSYRSVQWYGNQCYILDCFGKLFKKNILNNNRLEIIVDTQEYPLYFSFFLVTNTNIWFLPALGEDIKIFSDSVLTIYKSYPNDLKFIEDRMHAKFLQYCEDREYYYIAMHSANYLLKISKKTGNGVWIKISISYWQYMKSCQYMMKEKKRFNLEDLISALKVSE